MDALLPGRERDSHVCRRRSVAGAGGVRERSRRLCAPGSQEHHAAAAMERNSNMTTCQTQQERRGATTSRVAERLSDLLTHEIMTPRQALDFAIAIGDALALLHKSGKSHGGVSTENVWVHQNEAMLASRRPNAGVPMDDIVQFGALLRALLDVCQPQEGPLNTAM